MSTIVTHDDRINQLEKEVADLRKEIAALRYQIHNHIRRPDYTTRNSPYDASIKR